MEKNIPEWMNDFIFASFGKEADYSVLNQNDFVGRQNNQQRENDQHSLNQYFQDGQISDEKANVNGVNDQSGENYEVVVHNDKNKKDIGMQVEFSSGKNKEKYIISSLEEFCNGKYSNLKDQPLNMIAETIAKDNDYVSNFLETSTASLSEFLSIEKAIEFTDKVKIDSALLNEDYKKITSKLNNDDEQIYKDYLNKNNITVKSSSEKLNYCIDYIKNFKEYKIAKYNKNTNNMNSLKERIFSIKNFSDLKTDLLQEFSKDEVLKKIVE